MESTARLLIYVLKYNLPSLPHLLKQITDFVMNAIAICDASDELLWSQYPMRGRNFQYFFDLKCSAIKFLISVSQWQPFLQFEDVINNPKILETLIQLLLKNLICSNDTIREVIFFNLKILIKEN